MKLYLHCGPGKTGSSYIQRCLKLNSNLLALNGINTVSSLSSIDGDHHSLAEIIQQSHDKKSSHLLSLALADIVLKTKELNNSTAVVSSDLFANLSLKQWEYLISESREVGLDFHVIVYARNLFEISIATVNQTIKNGFHIDSIYRYLPFTYFPLLSRLAALLPLNRIICNSYHQKGTLFEDFMMSIRPSLPSTITYELPTHLVNPSISADHAAAINWINKFIDAHSPQSTHIWAALMWITMNTHSSQGKLQFSELEAHHLNEIFKNDLALLLEFQPKLGELLKETDCYVWNPALHQGAGVDHFLASTDKAVLLNNLLQTANINSCDPDFMHALKNASLA